MNFNGGDKREFLRVDYETLLNFKVMRNDKLITKTDITSRNISASGLLFRTTNESSIPALSSIIWVELDDHMMNICSEIENNLVIHNKGVFGRIVRISEGDPGKSFDIGVCFLRKSDISPEELIQLTSD